NPYCSPKAVLKVEQILSLPRQRHWLVVAVMNLNWSSAECRDYFHIGIPTVNDLMNRIGGDDQGRIRAELRFHAINRQGAEALEYYDCFFASMTMHRRARAGRDHLAPDFEVPQAMLGAGIGAVIQARQIKFLL